MGETTEEGGQETGLPHLVAQAGADNPPPIDHLVHAEMKIESQLMVLHASCSIDTKQLFNISYGQLMNCSNQLLVHRQIPRPSGSRSLFFKQYLVESKSIIANEKL